MYRTTLKAKRLFRSIQDDAEKIGKHFGQKCQCYIHWKNFKIHSDEAKEYEALAQETNFENMKNIFYLQHRLVS